MPQRPGHAGARERRGPFAGHRGGPAHLAALSALAGLCMEGRLGIDRATTLHVTSTLAALDAVSQSTEDAP
ncbi:MAG: hypothetical protein F2754_10390 [Actinobacteria bacterium]|uniref:Unannotated protein n=1 Tax=freshwater metagenome TaxID=449393 RepID=A0A6J7APW0_9ZZZZ|nr:hypothetical protein [Actinomycetota bacterium]MSY72641.1 hypothetical protein [Actinomycetota bacterium]